MSTIPGFTSAFLLELDTAPPVINWGPLSSVMGGDAVEIPYSLSEPGIVEAAWVDYDGYEYPVTVSADKITFSTPAYTSIGHARVRVLLRDDVWNESVQELEFEVRSHKFPLNAEVEDRGVYVSFDAPIAEVSLEDDGIYVNYDKE